MYKVNYIELFNLTDRWENMNQNLWENIFDYDNFRNLASDTFKIIFPYHSAKNIPKVLLELMFSINKFANCMIGGISEEHDVARLVAEEFCNQLADCWVGTEDGILENFL